MLKAKSAPKLRPVGDTGPPESRNHKPWRAKGPPRPGPVPRKLPAPRTPRWARPFRRLAARMRRPGRAYLRKRGARSCSPETPRAERRGGQVAAFPATVEAAREKGVV